MERHVFSWLKLTPYLLILARLTIAIMLLIDAFDGEVGIPFVAGLLLALLSDIFDGVLARKFGVVTNRLRYADSLVDSILFVCLFVSIIFMRGDVLITYAGPIVLNLFAYLLSLLIPLIKFGTLPAYHAYSAKAAGLLLISGLIVLIVIGDVPWLVWTALTVWFISHIDRILITIFLPEPRVDVASFISAYNL